MIPSRRVFDEYANDYDHWLNELRHTLLRGGLMPWNDPITEAPSLWAWQDAEGFEYEYSVAPLDASPGGRRGMESYLLYRYRQERGESTLCNFGRFHPRYRKSTYLRNNSKAFFTALTIG
jgi:hypothetical protein